ncbi:protein phosphatase 1 regulatory subunit 12A-like isoform X4 [Lethenteron reissneri]|uniref:protein phosphatase 1 regulatory subunit 12A-like isoform X4 n=1 Tax=Lethenteron reissneri TaxID=7753 RepID=UPI002AB7C256|nr:protein phosphatase 1 regulatory subunit 12A-like isoform X4 [Lethenteron reissneri]
MAADDRSRADSAKQKRAAQLKRWAGSETDLETAVLRRKKSKVKFDDGAVFLAACSSGDTDEVLSLIERGADINYANVDGLSALHQACIDENFDMVKFLVERDANINQADNEGWTPLHAAASCGYIDIAKYLIAHGANVAAVNSESELPLDITEDEALEDMLQEELSKHGVDQDAARKEEEQVMMRDARQWLNSGRIDEVRHPKSGGTALHVAAAKGYIDVIKLLLQAGFDVNVRDNDGWTPLHAAAHWGKDEACRVLVENFCNMEALNKVGQTAFDVSDEDVLSYLEELQTKQKTMKIEKEKQPINSEIIESNDTNSIKSRGKEGDGESKHDETSSSSSEEEDDEDEEEDQEGSEAESQPENHTGKNRPSVKENNNNKVNNNNEAMPDKTSGVTPAGPGVPPTSRASSHGLIVPPSAPTQTTPSSPAPLTVTNTQPPATAATTPTSPSRKPEFVAATLPAVAPLNPLTWRQGLRKTGIPLVPQKGQFPSSFPRAGAGGIAAGAAAPKEEEKKTVDVAPPASAPASWRSGLRKTGSHGALPEAAAAAAGATGAGEPPRDALRERGDVTQAGSGIARSASSPRLTTTETRERERALLAQPAGERDSLGTKLARVPPTISDNKFTFPRKPGTADPEEKENRDTVGMLLARSSSYTRRRFDDSSENTAPAYQRSSPNGRHGGEVSSSDSSSGLSPSSPPPVLPTSTSTTPVPTVRVSDDVMNVTSTAPVSAVALSVGSSSAIFRSRVEEAPERGSREGIGGGSGGTVPAVTVTVPPTVSGGSAPSLESGAALSGENRERRRSYLTPVRDEESESQRKARSRQARQTRRSTQGVTLTDLQEAEKIRRYGSDKRGGREQPEEKESAERLDDKKDTESREASDARGRPSRTYGSDTQDGPYQRLRPSASLAPAGGGSPAGRAGGGGSTGSGLGSVGSTRVPTVTVVEPERGDSGEEDSQTEGDKGKNKLSVVRDRRRPREKRRSTGVSFMSPDSQSDENDHDLTDEEEEESEEVEKEVKEVRPKPDKTTRFNTVATSTSLSENYSERYADRMRSTTSIRPGRPGPTLAPAPQPTELPDTKDYRKLYEQMRKDNEEMRKKLRDAQLQLAETKVQLERVTQRQERFADKTSLLEAEKREKRALERKVSEMEEEMKGLGDLRADNQRLKDENAALIRVISKLSK